MRASASVFGSLLWLALGACSEARTPTQVIVEIAVDSALEREAESLQIEIAPLQRDGEPRRERVKPDGPAKFVLAPRADDASRGYVVRATARSAEGRTLAALALQSGYVRDEARFVRMQLHAGCVQLQPLTRTPRQLGATHDAALELVGCEGSAADGGSDAATPPEDDAGDDPMDATTSTRDAADSHADGAAPAEPVQTEPTCDEGFRWIDGRCQSADPCQREPGRCEDGCEVRGESAICTCREGGIVKPHNPDQCWHWQAAVPLESSAVGVSGSNLAMNPRGAAIAAWLEGESPTARVWANRFEPGVGWREPIALTSAGDYTGFVTDRIGPVVAVAVDNAGNGLVLFQSNETAELSARLLPNEAWPMVGELATPGNGHHYAAALKRDPNGGFYVLSASGRLGGALSWWLRRYTRDGTWGAVIALDPPDGVALDYAAFGVAEATGALAFLWIDTAQRVWGSQLAATPPYELVTREVPGAMRAAEVGMTVDSQGTALGTWQASRPDADVFYTDLFETGIGGAATRWSEPRLIAMAVDLVERPCVVFDGANRETLAWIARGETRGQMYSQVFAAVAGQERAAHDAPDMGYSTSLDCSADAKGNVLVVWSRTPTEQPAVVRLARHDGDAWSAVTTLNDEASGDALSPRVASDRNGDAIVMWEQLTNGQRHLWARRFE